jgi:hypothetical protein
MGLRLGFGFRLARHVYLGATVPLGHARRCAQHDGHGSGNPVVGLIGLVVIYAIVRAAISG